MLIRVNIGIKILNQRQRQIHGNFYQITEITVIINGKQIKELPRNRENTGTYYRGAKWTT